MARSAIVVESPTLDECRKQAARELGVPAEKLVVRVVQKGKRGVFSSKPFRVRASIKESDSRSRGRKSSPFLSKLNTHVKMALIEMERLEILREGEEGRVFNQMLSSYESLPEERRKEVLDLSKLLSGPTARKIQEQVAKSGSFSVRISDDRLGAFISVSPPEGIGRAVTVRDVLERMREMKITQGVDHVKIRKLLGEVVELGRSLKDMLIAEGRAATPGRDGHIEYVETSSGREAVVRGDGSVDHRGRTRITMVREGQLLARLLSHTEGVAGVTACGEKIEPEAGKPAHLDAGDNVAFDPESGEYRAKLDGLLEMSDDTIHVRQIFAVPGDVDMATGNIEFNGTIRILGSVRDGFSVRATEDIEIQGGVEGCEIVSKQGSVRIAQGVAGRNRCFISAGRDVEAKYIENARVYARGSIGVGVAIMHSEMVAGNSVVAMKGKGAIIGGTTKAGNLVKALVLGAPSEPPTEVLVGISIEDQDDIRGMDQRLVALKNAAMHLEKVIKEFEHAAKNVEKLPPGERSQYVTLKKKLLVLHYEIDKAEAQRQAFLEKVTAEAKGMVQATREIFGRVIVRIGQFMDHVDNQLHGTAFRADLEQGCIVRKR